MLRIKLYRSPIGQVPKNRGTVAALGLRRPGHVVEMPDTPSVRGQIHAIAHMLVVENTETGETIVDARLIKRRSSTKDKKPSETH